MRFDHNTNDKTLVPDLWRRFAQRHRGISILLARQAKMKAFGKTVMERLRKAEPPVDAEKTHRRAGPKIGRNDFCPCGSGKKYKMCCHPSGRI